MIFRSRSLARRMRTMHRTTKIALGFAPQPRPMNVVTVSSILKRMWPQGRIDSGVQRLERPLWARIAFSRGWMSREKFYAVPASVTVESPFAGFIGAPVKAASLSNREFYAQQRYYPEPKPMRE